MKAMRSRWFGSMFAWILKTKPVILASSAFTVRLAAACARGDGANSAIASIRSLTPKSFSALPNMTGRQMPLEKGLLVERLQPLDREIELLDRRGALVLGQKLRDLWDRPGPSTRIVAAFLPSGVRVVAADVIGAGERAAAPDRPVERRGVERQRLFDLVEEIERVARLAVHLVDEGDDRNVPQPADLEQFSRPRFDALGGVDHHHRRNRPRSACDRCPRKSLRGRACREG